MPTKPSHNKINKPTLREIADYATDLRKQYEQAHDGVFNIYEFAKEHGVARIHHLGEEINVWATDDNHQEWGCNIPERYKQDTARFLLAVLVGWVILRDEDSPTSFDAYDPMDVLRKHKSLEEMRAELFAYHLMVPEYALADASIATPYNKGLKQFAITVSGVKDALASNLGVPPEVVENRAFLLWAFSQKNRQDAIRHNLDIAQQRRQEKNKKNSLSLRHRWGG
jgi:hypothetical protein